MHKVKFIFLQSLLATLLLFACSNAAHAEKGSQKEVAKGIVVFDYTQDNSFKKTHHQQFRLFTVLKTSNIQKIQSVIAELTKNIEAEKKEALKKKETIKTKEGKVAKCEAEIKSLVLKNSILDKRLLLPDENPGQIKEAIKENITKIDNYFKQKADLENEIKCQKKSLEQTIEKINDLIAKKANALRDKLKELYAKKIKDNGEEKFKMKRSPKKRWFSKKEYLLHVYVIHYDSQKAKIEFQEKERSSVIAEDFLSLAKMIPILLQDADAAAEPLALTENTYRLENKRSILTVTSDLDTSKPGIPSETKKSKKEITLIAGPSEHWFLAADLPLTKLSEVKYDSDKGGIEPKETPKEFYISLNFMLNDLFSDRPFYKNFFLKGMIKMSKSPFDSYGFGLGYRFPKIEILGLKLSSFSIFGAYLWTKEPVTDDGTETLLKHQMLFGVSYDLSKATKWVK